MTLHVCAALLALCLGPFALFRTRRDRWHKIAGYVWVLAMIVAAVSSLALTATLVPLVAGFGIIHLLSVYLLVNLAFAMWAIWQRRIDAHERTMRAIYWQALGIPALLTLLPGRQIGDALFDGNWVLALSAIGVGGAVLVWAMWPNRARRSPPRGNIAI